MDQNVQLTYENWLCVIWILVSAKLDLPGYSNWVLSLDTYDCVSTQPDISIFNVAEDTSVVRLISMMTQRQVQRLVGCCATTWSSRQRPNKWSQTSSKVVTKAPNHLTFWYLYGNNLMPGSDYMNLLMLSAAMEELDGDNVRVSSRGRVAERDIVQVWKSLYQGPHVQTVHRHKKVADVLFHAHNHIGQE